MNLALLSKVSRLLLVISVSVWMAGGCLFGCSNTGAMAAEVTESSVSAARDEKHDRAQAHSCCTRPVARQAKVKRTPRLSRAALASATTEKLTAPPHEMKDCPLLANNFAATSQNSSNRPDPGRTPVALLPSVESLNEETPVTIVSSHVPNRGPTHLRCCVFLI